MTTAAVPMTAERMRPPVWRLLALIVLCLGIGWAGSLFTAAAIPTWYQGLEKPPWTPPNWLFAPVWTTLYVAMGVAGWRVSAPASPAHEAWGWWWVQLALNGLWTPLFFGAHAMLSAAIVILLLWLTILQFIRLTWAGDRLAAGLFVPYLLWVTYAASLNIGIWALNR